MARVKNMARKKMASPGALKNETRLPRAMFSRSAIGGRTVTCLECRLTIHSGNPAKQKRVTHSCLKLPVEGWVSTQPAREKLIIKLPMGKEPRKRSAGEE